MVERGPDGRALDELEDLLLGEGGQSEQEQGEGDSPHAGESSGGGV